MKERLCPLLKSACLHSQTLIASTSSATHPSKTSPSPANKPHSTVASHLPLRMALEASNKPGKAALTLYANLLETSSGSSPHGTISRAPIVFKQTARDDLRLEEDSSSKQQLAAASLRFQPTKRPQLSSQKPKLKPTPQKAGLPPPAYTKTPDISAPDDIYSASRAQPKNTLADWTAEPELGEEGGFYNVEKRQRGGRKKRKKNLEDSQALYNWDDIYDPSRPNTFEDYKHSDEKMLELREWKDKLYAHRIVITSQSDVDSGGEISNQFGKRELKKKALFFAPPTTYIEQKGLESRSETRMSDAEGGPLRHGLFSQPTADEPSQSSNTARGRISNRRPTPEISTPPIEYTSNDSHGSSLPFVKITAKAPLCISRAPIQYKSSEDTVDPKSEPEHETKLYHSEPDSVFHDSPRSLRPGQHGFAERLMSKYGWTKGSGLGASGSGIVNPLRVQVEKQKKKPDAEGGGVVGHGGKGKILGGSRKGGSSAMGETGKFGNMSEVVILLGMVDGMDLDLELERSGDGGLMQEIGDECGAKYGRVERVYIDRSSPHKPSVFVKFTSQLSALRAVNALEGRVFNGNKITARFFDSDAFERGIYSDSKIVGNGQL